MPNELIKDIGEKELIKRISLYMPKKQTSDDCAFVALNNNNLLINTDLMVEDTHFNDNILSPFDLGWKAVTTNISDLISSGCDEIIGIKIGLILTKDTTWNWVKDLYKGMNLALEKFGGSILGGDCSRGITKTVAITALGTQGQLKLRRYLCQPNEIILTTGIHGLSKLGLSIKQNKISNQDLLKETKLIKDSIDSFCRPKPRQSILKQLHLSRINNKLEIGCTDSSDGLYRAILDLALESNCKAIIDYNKIPKHSSWPLGEKWDEYYFFGGEDYELVFSLPREWANNLLKIDSTVSEIGLFTKGDPAIEIINYKGKEFSVKELFSHF
tara:strand:+ start:141 stop:1124 length:984 start_codon:yes stop_codon:yes gene_type:complete